MQQTSRKTWAVVSLAASGGLIGLAAGSAGAQTINVNAAGGTAFNPAIFGQGLNNQAFETQGREAGYEKNLGLIEGTSFRGPSEGSNAMTYNWFTRVDKNQGTLAPGGNSFAKGKSTLEVLRDARDYGSMPVFTVNTGGIGGFDGVTNQWVFTDTSIGTLTQQAKDWVRYTNYIVQNYRQGQESQMSADDQRILNSIYWDGPDYSSDKLLAPGEAMVPKVNYWEIGNEVDLGNNSASPADYRSRYDQITTAMRTQDATIKTGPGLSGPQAGQQDYLKTVLKNGTFYEGGFKTYSKLQVDFITYHPYGYQVLGVDAGNPANHGAISQQLSEIRANQQAERNWVNTQINNSSSGAWWGSSPRSPSDFEYLATEWNPAYPSPPPGGDSNWRLRQWNALGVVETTMTYAQMGFTAAQFWLWPAYVNNGAELPQYKAFKALNEYGGDVLVKAVTSETSNRLYVTRDSQSGTVTIWGMNFLFGDPGDADKTFNISLTDLGITPGQITLLRLADTTGRTTLMSGNDFHTNGTSVDWITSDLTGQIDLSNFTFTVKPAELAMLVIQVPEPTGLALFGVSFGALALLRRRRQLASPLHGHHSYQSAAAGTSGHDGPGRGAGKISPEAGME
ncbi:MAG: PEP-CTERM sorting domain-containing protein [Phycisphaerales bacterium]|nr:PEP-CTERM sorting domain-containing protein [Phycisphaerales bacterium]